YQDRERGRLHAPDRGLVEAALLGIERRHGARPVDAHEPVRLGPAQRRVGEGQQLAVLAQLLEALFDRALGHRLEPQALDGLLSLGVARYIPEDQLALSTRVTGVVTPQAR